MSIWEKSWEIYGAADECYALLVKMRKVKHSEARDGPWRSWRCHRGRSAELNFRRYASHRDSDALLSKYQHSPLDLFTPRIHNLI